LLKRYYETTDKNEQKDIVNELYKNYLDFFKKIIHERNQDNEKDDFAQEMYFALLRALATYRDEDLQKRVKFVTIVAQSAHSRISNLLFIKYGRKREGRKVLLRDEPIRLNYSPFDEELELLEILPDETADTEKEFERKERREAIHRLLAEIDKLPFYYGTVIKEHYFNNKDLQDITSLVDKKVTTVRQSHIKALKILRENAIVREAAAFYDIYPKDEVKKDFSGLYRLKNKEAVKDISPLRLSRFTTLTEFQIRSVIKEKTVFGVTAKTFSELMKIPLLDLFERVETPPNKKTYKAIDPEFWCKFDYNCFLEQLTKDNVPRTNFNRDIRLLRTGGVLRRTGAERFAALLNKPFDELFVEVIPE
jgi:RNA polymerase sigma factor (sigma-70 family)